MLLPLLDLVRGAQMAEAAGIVPSATICFREEVGTRFAVAGLMLLTSASLVVLRLTYINSSK